MYQEWKQVALDLYEKKADQTTYVKNIENALEKAWRKKQQAFVKDSALV